MMQKLVKGIGEMYNRIQPPTHAKEQAVTYAKQSSNYHPTLIYFETNAFLFLTETVLSEKEREKHQLRTRYREKILFF